MNKFVEVTVQKKAVCCDSCQKQLYIEDYYAKTHDIGYSLYLRGKAWNPDEEKEIDGNWNYTLCPECASVLKKYLDEHIYTKHRS